MQNPVIIACRCVNESNRIKETCQLTSVPTYFESKELFDRLSDGTSSVIIATSLIADETSIGIVTKSSIISQNCTIIWANHATRSQNLLRLFGSGCYSVLGPDELDLLPEILSQTEEIVNDIVIPPFFIDDGVSNLKAPDKHYANRLHVTFIGAQAMMSCSNAILNIRACDTISMACLSTLSPWVQAQLSKNFPLFTLWRASFLPIVKPMTITYCQNLKELISLEPACKHIVVCHGYLSKDEENYLAHLSPNTLIFQACEDGYVDNRGTEQPYNPERFWDFLISSTY